MASSPSATDISLLIFTVSGFIGILLFFIFYIVYAYQRKSLKHKQEEHNLQVEMKQKMLQALVTGQEKERARLSRDMHDSLGAQLSTVKLYLAELRAQSFNPSADELLKKSTELLTASIQDLRAISQDLVPRPLQRMGLVSTLRTYCDKLSVAHKRKICLITNVDQVSAPQSISLMIFRIVQEVINNAIKHGDSQTIVVTLSDQVHEISINIEEDGLPYNWEDAKAHSRSNSLGLLNIETRVSLMNGTLRQTNVDDRNIVSIKIPASEEQEEKHPG